MADESISIISLNDVSCNEKTGDKIKPTNNETFNVREIAPISEIFISRFRIAFFLA